MLAAVGASILSLSILGFGFSYNRHLRNEKESLSGIVRLIERIKARIECFRSPLYEIYSDFSHPFLDGIGFTEDLKKSGLAFALVKNKNRLGLSNAVFSELNDFAQGLGKSYADEQIRFCSSYIDKFKKELSDIERDIPVKMRLSLTLSAAGAAMTAILFL